MCVVASNLLCFSQQSRSEEKDTNIAYNKCVAQDNHEIQAKFTILILIPKAINAGHLNNIKIENVSQMLHFLFVIIHRTRIHSPDSHNIGRLPNSSHNTHL